MKGVYSVFLRIRKSKRIKIGALGEIEFEPGIYVYVGSAMNSVEKRVERHFSDTENKHWHMDYFSEEANPLDSFVLPEKSDYECVLSEVISEIAEPVDGIGSSDCDCDTHLYRNESTREICED